MSTYVEYSADTSKYESAMAQMQGLSEKTLNFVKDNWLGLGTAIGLAYKTFDMFNEALASADQLNKLSKSTGIATEELSAYKYAADLSGVSIEETARGIQKLSQNMVEAATGSKEASKAFDLLGISVKDQTGQLRPADAVLEEIANRFARMPDGATKAALAVEFFGKSGASLIPMLNEGAVGLDRMRGEAERMGLIIGGDTAKASEALNDNIEKMTKAFRSSALVLLAEYVPALERASEALLDFLGITGKGAEQHLRKQRAEFERELADLEAAAQAPEGFDDLSLSWVVRSEDAKIAELKSRIALIDKTLAGMTPIQAPEPGGPINPTIPEGWGKTPKGPDKEMERLQERAEMEMLKAQETLTMKSDMEKFMEADLDEYLYNMRQTRLEAETGFAQKRIELRQWEHDAALQIAQQEASEETRLAQERERIQAQGTMNMLQNATYVFKELGKQNKAAFVAYKAFAIAETIINTYKAAMGAYSAMASIPYVGPYLAVAAAAAAVAAGMMNISKIASAEPGGGTVGGEGGGAVGVYSASPTTGLPSGIPAGAGEEKGRTLTINIQGDFIGDEAYVENLAEKISKAVEDRDVRLVASNANYAAALA